MAELLGIDLNSYRADLTGQDFDRLHDAGCRFLGQRLTVAHSVSGELVRDETASRYIGLARARGWTVFGYAYLNPRDGMKTEPDRDGYEQGRFYADTAGMYRLDGQFLDVEAASIRQPHIVHANIGMRQGFIDDMCALGLYSRDNVMSKFDPLVRGLFDYEWFARYVDGAVWLNDWQTKPEQETSRTGRLWQKTETLRWRITIDGKKVTRSVDGDVFDGTQQQLLRYLGREI